MTDAYFRKTFGALRPVDDQATEAVAAVKEGTILRVQWSRPRNLRQLRLYWALCRLVAQNTKGYDEEAISDLLKIGTGHVTLRSMPGTGEIFHIPKSISFGALGQDEFNVFFNRAIDFILQQILPGANRADLEREVFEMIGIPLPESGAATKPGGSAAEAGPATPALPPEPERKEMAS